MSPPIFPAIINAISRTAVSAEAVAMLSDEELEWAGRISAKLNGRV